MDDAIERGQIPGAVVHVEHAGENFRHVSGWRSVAPTVEPMTEDTIFDVASLTKVVATAPAIMKLVEEGKVALEAPVGAYVRAFVGEGREVVTVRQLLSHTSGLPAGIRHDAAAPWDGYDEGIARACREPLRSTPGTRFLYSDVNFILLGEIVRQVSGQWISEFARRVLFDPLGMKDTGFLPAEAIRPRIAPTEYGAGGGALARRGARPDEPSDGRPVRSRRTVLDRGRSGALLSHGAQSRCAGRSASAGRGHGA
ncbi:MAG: serine hydrolase domain-containing protein [Verrucomicrobiales bacterium]